VTNLHQLTPLMPYSMGDRIVTKDVISPYVYATHRLPPQWQCGSSCKTIVFS